MDIRGIFNFKRVSNNMNKMTVIIAGAVSLVLAGCASSRIPDIKMNPPAGEAFEIGLHQGYIKLAEMEAAEFDWGDADTFANRADAISGGAKVGPEAISSRNLPAINVATMTAVRERLMNALNAGGATVLPKEAANAQVMFDCWMQEQEENFQPEDIAACRASFTASIEKLEAALKPAMPAPTPAPMKAEMPALPAPMVVYFGFDSADLDGVAAATVDQAVKAFKLTKATKIMVRGYTDASGASAYNTALSELRVAVVLGALMDRGMNDKQLAPLSYGEKNQAVKTADGAKEGKNRRVELNFHR
jgi:outer membrane protein OmpA-like peptidoglycan-associated protein/outer membrane murein-binding lipoprotein Lpp